MIEKHPTETQLQEFALDQGEVDTAIMEHVELCKQCRAQVANYQMIFSAIKEQEKPSFDFDLAHLVLSDVEQKKVTDLSDKWFSYLIVFAIILVAAIAWYLFGQSLADLFNGFEGLFVAIIAISAFVVLIFQVIDMFRKYREKIHFLDLH